MNSAALQRVLNDASSLTGDEQIVLLRELVRLVASKENRRAETYFGSVKGRRPDPQRQIDHMRRDRG